MNNGRDYEAQGIGKGIQLSGIQATPAIWAALAAAVVAGGLRWWLGRHERRSFYDDTPAGVSAERHRRRTRLRRFGRRLFATGLWMMGGSALGWSLAALLVKR